MSEEYFYITIKSPGSVNFWSIPKQKALEIYRVYIESPDKHVQWGHALAGSIYAHRYWN